MTAPTGEELREALREVFDPELGYNIVDLGLIYDIAIEGSRATITMTMTTPGCPAVDIIRNGVFERASAIPGLTEVAVDVVWNPPWNADRMSDAAKAHFGV
jgi:metal-sulfur cluster biosynthetic enzyme